MGGLTQQDPRTQADPVCRCLAAATTAGIAAMAALAAALATPARREELARQIIQLSFWYARHRMQQLPPPRGARASAVRSAADSSFADALFNRTPIVVHLGHLSTSERLSLQQRVERLFNLLHGGDAREWPGDDGADLERQGLALVWGLARAKLLKEAEQRQLQAPRRPNSQRPYESWSLDYVSGRVGGGGLFD